MATLHGMLRGNDEYFPKSTLMKEIDKRVLFFSKLQHRALAILSIYVLKVCKRLDTTSRNGVPKWNDKHIWGELTREQLSSQEVGDVLLETVLILLMYYL